MREEKAFGGFARADVLEPGGSSAADDARLRTEHVRRAASGLFHKLTESVEAMIHDQKIAGAAIISDVARAGFHAAEDIERSTPDAARLLRKASAGVEQVAETLRSDDLGQIFGSLRDFGRAQPLAFVGGAVVGGFLIARSVRSGRLTSAVQEMTARAAAPASAGGAR